jgi:hypothetical protein
VALQGSYCKCVLSSHKCDSFPTSSPIMVEGRLPGPLSGLRSEGHRPSWGSKSQDRVWHLEFSPQSGKNEPSEGGSILLAAKWGKFL